MKIKEKNVKINVIIFLIYISISAFLAIKHEPWRDEIHGWLMAKEYSIFELFKISRIEGHPILWHLILMPFAKLNFSVYTLKIINYVIVTASAGIYWFNNCKKNKIFKIFVLFTVPFMYVYSSFSRNYSLILLLLVLIACIYNKRKEIPILYSVLICFLIHTHVMAWGIVAGLTITFHIDEIIKYIKTKERPHNFNKVIIGFSLIVINTIFIVFELYQISKPYGGYIESFSFEIIFNFIIMFFVLIGIFILNIIYKIFNREFFILLLGYAFMFFVCYFYYSIPLIQRTMLIYMYFLFYINVIEKGRIGKVNGINKYIKYLIFLYVTFLCINGINYIDWLVRDINMNFSSAEEIGNYINDNLPDNVEILTPYLIFTQTIIPYCDSASQYDIVYNYSAYCANNIPYDYEEVENAIKDLSMYNNRYIIVTEEWTELIPDDCLLIYNTSDSIIDEKYYLYYIDY